MRSCPKVFNICRVVAGPDSQPQTCTFIRPTTHLFQPILLTVLPRYEDTLETHSEDQLDELVPSCGILLLPPFMKPACQFRFVFVFPMVSRWCHSISFGERQRSPWFSRVHRINVIPGLTRNPEVHQQILWIPGQARNDTVIGIA